LVLLVALPYDVFFSLPFDRAIDRQTLYKIAVACFDVFNGSAVLGFSSVRDEADLRLFINFFILIPFLLPGREVSPRAKGKARPAFS